MSVKQVQVGSAIHDIIPEYLTDGTYTAQCPTLSANTYLEVTANKVTSISASSTDDQYPTAKAVYDLIPTTQSWASYASAPTGGANKMTVTPGSATKYVHLSSSALVKSTDYLTISGDADLVAANIVSGVNIFGIDGSATKLVSETRDETMTASPTTFTPSTGKNGITSIKVTATSGSYTLSGSVSSTPTATLKQTAGVTLSSTATSYYITVGKNSATNGSVTHSATITTGWIANGAAATTNTATSVGANVTAKTFYLPVAESAVGTTASGTTWKTIIPASYDQYINITAGYTPAGNIKVSAASPGTWSSYVNISNDVSDNNVPLIATAGYFDANSYLSSLTVGAEYYLDDLTNHGQVTILSNTGILGDTTYSTNSSTGIINIQRNDGDINITLNYDDINVRDLYSGGRITVDRVGDDDDYGVVHVKSMGTCAGDGLIQIDDVTNGTVNISSNSGLVDIDANTGTVNYLGWVLVQDSAGNITFTYAG